MKLLCHLVHPAHYHLFKHAVRKLEKDGWEILYTIRNKDVLKDLVTSDGYEYINIEDRHRTGLGGYIARLKNLYSACKSFRPSVIISSAVEAAYAAKLTKCTSLLFFEDDLKQVKIWAILTAPVATKLICPDSCDAWLWNYKAQKYPGYHELAYLHPNHFKKIETDNKYNKKYLIRLAKLTAYHDKKNPGIDDALLEKIINKLEEYGDVVISGERGLPVKYQKYGKKIAPAEMLQFLANVDLYIGDSQTMAAEAAVLGVPSIRYNNFVGKLGYLEELEHKYKLTFGIRQGNTEELLKKIDDFLSITDVKNIWNKNRQIMLQQKIDVSKYIVDLVKQA